MNDLWAPGIADEDRAWRRGEYDRHDDEPTRADFEDETSDTPDDWPW